MTPASKGAQVKRASASRSAASGTSRVGNKKSSAKVEAAASTRSAPTKKKAAPVVKKAATVEKKPASPAKKSTVVAPKKAGSAAVGSRASGANGAGAVVAPARTTFSPKPKPPPPVRPKTGPYAKDTKFLDEVRELLQADRAIYQEQATSLRAEADSLALEREPGDVQFDEESGEGGTVTVDRERNLALSGQATLAVEEIDDALRRIDDKTYGYCERCFQPIPKPRLRALPYARLCVACKSGGLSRR